jgi:hypothetical protein
MKNLLLVISAVLAVSCAKPKDGVDGVVGPKGARGLPGATGPAGSNGNDGRDGSDAHSVVAVKLCPGTTNYPSTFVEYAFCIEGELYATYSANDGFTSILPPGLYQSNAIGSSCQFEVQANCTVIAR